MKLIFIITRNWIRDLKKSERKHLEFEIKKKVRLQSSTL